MATVIMTLDLMHIHFSFFGRNVIIFRVNNILSIHVNKSRSKKYISELKNIFYSSMHYNGCNSFFYVNGVRAYQFKAKDSEVKRHPLCLSSISKYFTVDNFKKTGLNGCIFVVFLLLLIMILLVMVIL